MYFQKLCGLLLKKDLYLLNKTVAKNALAYHIDEKDISFVNELLFQTLYKKFLVDKPNLEEIIHFMKQYGKDPETEFDTDLDWLINKYYNELESRNLEEGIDIKNYKYLEYSTEPQQIFIYENQYFGSLDAGKNFGDYALDGTGRVRNATIIGEDDYNYLGVIKLNVYQEYILVEKEKLKNKEVHFLMDNFFFKNVKYKAFSYKYFFNFRFDEYPRDTILFRENDHIDCLYFIKEGEVEMTVNKSILDLQKLTKSFTMLDKTKLVDDFNPENGN